MEELNGRTDTGLADEVIGTPATESSLETPNAGSLILRRTGGRGENRSELQIPNSEFISNNSELVSMWLHGKPALTVKRYAFWVKQFFETVKGKPLHLVTLEDMQRWQNTLGQYAPNTQRNALASIKSLLTFGFEL
jgi:Phage integrase, N-terminal SAM-like domain